MTGGALVIGRKREAERNLVFPGAGDRVWNRKGATKGFTTVPRSMPLLCAIMDALNKGSPVSSVYVDLWFKVYDEMYLIIESPEERSYFSGFSGQRAVTTWTTRMRLLAQTGFIEVQRGTRGEFHHVLLVNPILAVAAIEKDRKRAGVVGHELLAAYHQRQREVGAEETLAPPPTSSPPGPAATLAAQPMSGLRIRRRKTIS